VKTNSTEEKRKKKVRVERSGKGNKNISFNVSIAKYPLEYTSASTPLSTTPVSHSDKTTPFSPIHH
jgi:hypothetical protein